MADPERGACLFGSSISSLGTNDNLSFWRGIPSVVWLESPVGVWRDPSCASACGPSELHKFGVLGFADAWSSLGPCMDSPSQVAAVETQLPGSSAPHRPSASLKWLWFQAGPYTQHGSPPLSLRGRTSSVPVLEVPF